MSAFSKKRGASDSGSDIASAFKAVKKTKHGIAADGEDDEGNPFWELSNKRRVVVSTFKGMDMISIREYYEKDGKTLPGKKGISLSVAQYMALLKTMPAINATLRRKGHAVEDAEDLSDAPVDAPTAKKSKSKAEKSNIEATSDEEED